MATDLRYLYEQHDPWTPDPNMDNPRLPFLRDKVKGLPLEPGVYIMRDKAGKIIYIGKAKILRNRVGSYFRALDKHTEKTYRLVENINDFDTIVTGSEFEALVLECSMIKQYKPRYNILLKDDKGYSYICITDEPYPRISACRMRESGSTDRYLGPYMSSFVVTQTVEEAGKVFQLPTCKRKFPEDFRKARPCLNFHIKRCMGVCTGRFSQSYYNEIIEQCYQFITGGAGKVLESLEKDMLAAAEAMQYEKAAALRDKVRAIKKSGEHQNVVFVKAANQDAIALVQNADQCVAAVIKIREQRLVDKVDYQLGQVDSLEEARQEFLMTYYAGQSDIPRLVSLDGPCEDQELVARFLSEKAKRQVGLHVPVRGEKLRLVEMARTNAAQTLSEGGQRTGKELAAVDELQRLLGLSATPVYIEAYDISNMGSDTVVGGMVAYENGRPLRSAYKKFNIKTVEGTDDYASMREVIARRLSHYEEESAKGTGFGRMPDLILLDGGKGHVNAVAPVLEDMGFTIPLFGMVKDQKHRTRAIATDGGEIAIQSNRSAFTLLSSIQDEVHRFTITHMKGRRSKSVFTSALTEIPGIGEGRVKALLRHFKTQAAIKEASVEELAAAKGMTKAAAENVYRHFHPTIEQGEE
ncbi:MAG: excinuclease ABC subunit UvrC [Oscillospiraceae bacterium]